jgi:cytochrome c biogenesis protein CcmG/thiol:disulfide interchange protein DsbE
MQRFVPLVLVLLLFGLFLKMLTDEDRNPQEIKSVMIGRSAPAFSVPSLLHEGDLLTEAALKTGKPVLVNFFASWCLPCRAEHENLMEIGARRGFDIIGIAYKVEPGKSRAFLDEMGNPYALTGVDRDGRLAIDWGVTGVPETFLISGDGTITYRHWGPIVGDSFEMKLLPAMEALR